MTITLPCFGITIELGDEDSGRITSQLREGTRANSRMRAALDAIEALVLAHACAGVDVASPAYVEGVETAVEACWNDLS